MYLIDASSVLDAMREGKSQDKNILYKFTKMSKSPETKCVIAFESGRDNIVSKYFAKNMWKTHQVKCPVTTIRTAIVKNVADFERMNDKHNKLQIYVITARPDKYKFVRDAATFGEDVKVIVYGVSPPE